MNVLGNYDDADIARVAHEANRALQAIHNDPGVPVGLPWEQLPGDDRDSVVDGVRFIRAGYATSPGGVHEHWYAYKRGNGWTLGHPKDTVARTHPNLLPYEALPKAQRDKACVFFSVVTALLATSQTSGQWIGARVRPVGDTEIRAAQ